MEKRYILLSQEQVEQIIDKRNKKETIVWEREKELVPLLLKAFNKDAELIERDILAYTDNQNHIVAFKQEKLELEEQITKAKSRNDLIDFETNLLEFIQKWSRIIDSKKNK